MTTKSVQTQAKGILKLICTAAFVGLLTLGGGCGADPCEASFSKAKACYSKLDCNTLSGVAFVDCAFTTAISYEDLRNAEGYECDDVQAEKYTACTLDPATCGCES